MTIKLNKLLPIKIEKPSSIADFESPLVTFKR